jgi:hypothetical protein
VGLQVDRVRRGAGLPSGGGARPSHSDAAADCCESNAACCEDTEQSCLLRERAAQRGFKSHAGFHYISFSHS